MSILASCLTGLVEFWPFDEGSGVVAGGYKAGHDLALARSAPSGGAVSAAAGWTNEPAPDAARDTYNGGGLLDITAFNLLAATGDAVTIAVRAWPGGGQIQGGAWPGINIFQFFGMGGNYTDNNSAYSGFRMTDVALNVPSQAIYLEGVLGSPTISLAGWTYPKASPPYTPHLFLWTITRGATDMTIDFFVDGTQKAGSMTIANTVPDLTRLMLGSIHWSTSSTTQAALWDRELTDAEILSMGNNLDGLFGLIDGDDDPLLDEDGNSALFIGFPIRRTDVSGVIATRGEQRHTRRTHERRRRRYTLPLHLATPAEVALVAGAIDSTRNGNAPLRWRHPKDDPPPPADPVRYRLVNAGEAAMELARNKGAVSAELTLVLESV